MKRVLIAAGGTGGHIFPGLAIASALKRAEPDIEITFVGSYVGQEKHIVPQYGYPIELIHALGFEKGFSKNTIKAARTILQSRKDAKKLLKRIKPDLVIGTGGFTCAVLVWKAAKQHIPTLIHEQNSFPGRANRMLGKCVDKIAISFEEAAGYFPGNKLVLTGNPVRDTFKQVDHEEKRSELGLKPDQKMVLSMGGSLGAEAINRSMIDVIAGSKTENIVFYMLTGPADYDEVVRKLLEKGVDVQAENIHIEAFSTKMDSLLGAADLIVSRSGATSIAEIAAIGVPSVLIPYPYAAGDHQTVNANSIVDLGGAVMIPDHALNGEVLQETIEKLISTEGTLEKMANAVKKFGKTDADVKLANEALKLMNKDQHKRKQHYDRK